MDPRCVNRCFGCHTNIINGSSLWSCFFFLSRAPPTTLWKQMSVTFAALADMTHSRAPPLPQPQLIGLCGAELVAAESVGAAEGFLGLVAYMVRLRGCAHRLSPSRLQCRYSLFLSQQLLTDKHAVQMLTPPPPHPYPDTHLHPPPHTQGAANAGAPLAICNPAAGATALTDLAHSLSLTLKTCIPLHRAPPMRARHSHL